MSCEPSGCASCANRENLVRLGVDISRYDYVVALAGNPNTGKSTVFNALTGLRQHTGNWPGKTVSRAEGGFSFNDRWYKLVDLPGTYSLLSASTDEEVARNFILFGRPDCTIVVVDATALQRNLNLALQVMEITPRVVVCVNLLDEAARRGIKVDVDALAEQLGVPCVGTVARTGRGIDRLLEVVDDVASRRIETAPNLPEPPQALMEAVDRIVPQLEEMAPGLPSARWIAYRLLEGDHAIRKALETGDLQTLVDRQQSPADAGEDSDGAVVSLTVGASR